MTGQAGPPLLSAAEFGELLVAPDAPEQLSPIEGPGCVVLDLSTSTRTSSGSARERLRSQLPTLPCVTVALLGDGDEGSPGESLATLCDVRVSDRAGLDRLLAEETNLPIHVDEEPLTCVVRGAGRILDDLPRYRGVLAT